MLRTSTALLATAILLIACGETPPPDAATLLTDARAALGANPTTIEFSGGGQDASIGQPWNIQEGWPMWSVSDYNRVIDYGNGTSLQSAVREIADPTKLGGGGAQPGGEPQNQNSTVAADGGFNQKLQIWLTPHGFLNLAGESNPTITAETMNGVSYNVASFTVPDGDIAHQMRGYFNAESSVLEEVQTWVDNPVYGDMLIEAEYGNYQDFGGTMFPTSYVQKQGGFDTLNLNISDVVPNTTASAEPEPQEGGGRGRGGFGGGRGGRGGRGGGDAADAPPPFVELGEGIFVLDGGYQSVAVEFEDFSVVIDGLQNNARAADIIANTKVAIPDKPIRYWVMTHMHFDHISGIRDMVAEGVTIVTHEGNVDFLLDVLDNPRTMNPDRLAGAPMAPMVEGAGDTWVLEDGTQLLELYKLEGSLHADDMMIAYLPSINAIVEADLAQPWMNPPFGRNGHPFTVYFAEELERIGIAFEQIIPVHRPTPGPAVSREAFLAAAEE
jgi:glyoxylase-like metal-dependent hydrolase (beta-lactamase superfamily II)